MSTLDNVSDAELARRAGDGCLPSMEALIVRHENRLFRFLHARMQNRSNAEDLMQETFLKAFRKIHRYNPKYAFTTWLFTIANRLAASAWRKHRPMAEDLPDVQDEAPCPASLTEQNDTRENLWTHARQLLNDAQYAVLWLHYGEDLPVKEIARALRRTSTGVKVLLHRARNNLGHSLADTSHNPRQPDLAALPTTS